MNTLIKSSLNQYQQHHSQRLVIGLTGGIASGKTTVSDYFKTLGVGIVDTDVIAHQLTQTNGEAIPLIQAQFGAAYINEQGSLNRPAMRTLIFNDPMQRERLELILHPLIKQHALNLIKTIEGVYIMLVVPLLIDDLDWLSYINRCLVVDCDTSLQEQRLMQRSGLSRIDARLILNAQVSRQRRLQYADDIIVNDTSNTSTDLHNTIKALHDTYLQYLNQCNSFKSG